MSWCSVLVLVLDLVFVLVLRSNSLYLHWWLKGKLSFRKVLMYIIYIEQPNFLFLYVFLCIGYCMPQRCLAEIQPPFNEDILTVYESCNRPLSKAKTHFPTQFQSFSNLPHHCAGGRSGINTKVGFGFAFKSFCISTWSWFENVLRFFGGWTIFNFVPELNTFWEIFMFLVLKVLEYSLFW